MDQEEQYLKKHLIDLSRRANEKNMFTFSSFLNMNELNIFHQISKDLYTPSQLFGGYSCAERQMVAFIPDALSYVSVQFPIHVIRIAMQNLKFAESLTHRDVLGALMNLGIKREVLGDILVRESEIIVFCVDTMSSFIIDNCTRIRHTAVTARQIPASDFDYTPTFEQKESIVSSYRLDAIVADVCKLARAAAKKLILEGNVFVNSRKILQTDYNCQDGDILSVRHFGKFQIETTDQVTKKGRMKYIYKVYT